MAVLAIRRAGSADAELVLTMVRELADYQDEGKYVTGTLGQWQELLGRDDVIVLVAEQDGAAVGYVSAFRRPHFWTGGEYLHLDDLYVRPEARDGGIGRRLMMALAEYGRAELAISWSIRLDNTAAHRFYERLGATLRTKTLASWPAEAQAAVLGRPGES